MENQKQCSAVIRADSIIVSTKMLFMGFCGLLWPCELKLFDISWCLHHIPLRTCSGTILLRLFCGDPFCFSFGALSLCIPITQGVYFTRISVQFVSPCLNEMEISSICCCELLWYSQRCYCCCFTFPSKSRRILVVLWARAHILTDCVFRYMLDRTCYIHLFFLCVLFLRDWDGSSGPSGRTRRCFICWWTLNIQTRNSSRDSNGSKAGADMKRITRARDQAERLRRTDTGTQVTERTEKIL